jgi:hypothetical protein
MQRQTVTIEYYRASLHMAVVSGQDAELHVMDSLAIAYLKRAAVARQT